MLTTSKTPDWQPTSSLMLILWAFLSIFLSSGLNAETIIVKPGSELIDGNKLKPFFNTWTQYSTTPEGKTKSATYFERLESDNATGNWSHTQKVTHNNGTIVTNKTLFDKSSMMPVSIRQGFENAPEQAPKSREFIFNETGYSVETHLNDGEVIRREVATPTKMFNVANLGLVFSAMKLEQGKSYRMPSTFPQYQDGQYWMTISGIKPLELKGEKDQSIPALQLDIYWLNIKDGDEYPAGPKNSGGAYIISKTPEVSGAPVAAYVNDSTAILQEGIIFP